MPDREALPAIEVAAFSRTFHHQDWVDGEDVIQAGSTPGEPGFNQRFHQIEADLDSLGALVGQAVNGLAAMRASLHTMLEDVRVEVARMQGPTEMSEK